jgi:hypothetical protein
MNPFCSDNGSICDQLSANAGVLWAPWITIMSGTRAVPV